ncbi:MAG: Gfo/Idh/MocA family protein [Leptolyngbyaceae cyanobacterium]
MQIGIIGCGFVADYYLKTLALHPELKLIGVMDRDSDRASRFSTYHSVPAYSSLDELLADPKVELVLNLTNPHSHYEVSKACLEAGKHVYSEKPLSTDMGEAKELVELAQQKNLYIASAPCNFLSESAQTMWKALREQVIGKAYLVYAEMDDGMVHQMAYDQWLSESGLPWPYKDEFEVGCTLEHAGYYLTWLAAFFGPAVSVTAFSDCLIKDKEVAEPLEVNAPDFSVACIKFACGVVARLTCSILAPHDHTLRIIGEKGILYTKDCWYYASPVYIKKRINIRRKTFISPLRQKYPFASKPISKFGYKGSQQMDFCRGVAELAAAIKAERPSRLSADYCLHVNEMVLAIQDALDTGAPYKMTTTFEPIEPGF